MGATALRTKFGDRVVETISNVDRIFRAELSEADQKNNGFVVWISIELLKGNTAIPCTKHQGFECEIHPQVELIELTLMSVLKRRRDASLTISHLSRYTFHTRLHQEFKS